MALFAWKDEFSVSVGELDGQHKRLIELIALLGDAMAKGKSRDIIGKVLDDLVQYTLNHFSTEEKYFSRFSYPATATHILEHRQFIGKVSDFQKKFTDGNIALSVEVMQYLKEWLQHHIMVVDKRYAPFFNEHGLR